eukprot:180143_1
MDSFLESDGDNEIESNQQEMEHVDDGVESYDELSTDGEHPQEEIKENDDETDDDENYNFTLDDIDWNKVSKSMGDNVEIIQSKDKDTPPLLLKKLRKVCNEPLLKQKLNELQNKTASLPWFETLTVSAHCPQKGNKLNAAKLKNNDINREVFFYENTLKAVKKAMDRVKKEVPNGENIIQRPNDFYAEMMKSDDLMKKIKGRILWEQKKIGIVENRKKNKRLKKYHKQMMSQKIKENQKKIKNQKDEIEAWKHSVNRDDRSLQQIMKEARGSYLDKMKGTKKKKPNMKRIIKNLKYGSGYTKGIKGKNKSRNTYSSTNAYMGDWKRSKQNERRGGDALFRGNGGKRKNVKRQRGILGKYKKRGSAKRPGKSVRKKMYRSK